MKGNICGLCVVLDGAEDNEQQNIPNDNQWFTVVEQYSKMTRIVGGQFVDSSYYITQVAGSYSGIVIKVRALTTRYVPT